MGQCPDNCQSANRHTHFNGEVLDTVKRVLGAGLVVALCATLGACSTGTGSEAKDDGPTFPDQRIEYTVPFGPGGGTDLISRKLAAVAEPILGQQVVIVNKPGGSGTIGPSEVMRAKPDGYTIGLSNNQGAVFTPMTVDLPYDGPEDYQPIIKLSELPCVLVVRDDSPYKTLADFTKAAQADPGSLTIGVAGKLTACDLVWQGQFAKEANVEAVTAPFTGGAGEAATALLGGKTDGFLGDIIAVLPHIRSGDMRALVVFQEKRHSLLKETPSIVEAGYSNTLPITYFVMGPAGMPKSVVDTLYSSFAEAIKSAEFQDWAAGTGYVLDPKGPADLLAELQSQRAQYEKIISVLGVGKK